MVYYTVCELAVGFPEWQLIPEMWRYVKVVSQPA